MRAGLAKTYAPERRPVVLPAEQTVLLSSAEAGTSRAAWYLVIHDVDAIYCGTSRCRSYSRFRAIVDAEARQGGKTKTRVSAGDCRGVTHLHVLDLGLLIPVLCVSSPFASRC